MELIFTLCQSSYLREIKSILTNYWFTNVNKEKHVWSRRAAVGIRSRQLTLATLESIVPSLMTVYPRLYHDNEQLSLTITTICDDLDLIHGTFSGTQTIYYVESPKVL